MALHCALWQRRLTPHAVGRGDILSVAQLIDLHHPERQARLQVRMNHHERVGEAPATAAAEIGASSENVLEVLGAQRRHGPSFLCGSWSAGASEESEAVRDQHEAAEELATVHGRTLMGEAGESHAPRRGESSTRCHRVAGEDVEPRLAGAATGGEEKNKPPGVARGA